MKYFCLNKSKLLKLFLLTVSLHVSLLANAAWEKTANGMKANHSEELLSVTFVNKDVVRIQYVPEGEFVGNETNILVDYEPSKVKIKYIDTEESVSMKTENLLVKVLKSSGAVQIYSSDGKLLLSEDPLKPRTTEQIEIRNVVYDDSNSVIEKTANGDVKISNIVSDQPVGNAWKAVVNYKWQDGEALYGLGSHQEPHYNLRGTMQYLYQHNLKATVPVLMSSLGYGLLFNVGSTM